MLEKILFIFGWCVNLFGFMSAAHVLMQVGIFTPLSLMMILCMLIHIAFLFFIPFVIGSHEK